MRNITIAVIVALALSVFVGNAMSAMYSIQPGDSWQLIARKVSKETGIKHTESILQEINYSVKKLLPGKKLAYVSQADIEHARKWIDLCINAGYEDPIYFLDRNDLNNKIVRSDSGRRLLNFAETYRLGARP